MKSATDTAAHRKTVIDGVVREVFAAGESRTFSSDWPLAKLLMILDAIWVRILTLLEHDQLELADRDRLNRVLGGFPAIWGEMLISEGRPLDTTTRLGMLLERAETTLGTLSLRLRTFEFLSVVVAQMRPSGERSVPNVAPSFWTSHSENLDEWLLQAVIWLFDAVVFEDDREMMREELLPRDVLPNALAFGTARHVESVLEALRGETAALEGQLSLLPPDYRSELVAALADREETWPMAAKEAVVGLLGVVRRCAEVLTGDTHREYTNVAAVHAFAVSAIIRILRTSALSALHYRF